MVKTFLNKFKNQIISFYRGRYGNDQLNSVFYVVVLIFWLANIYLQNFQLLLIIYILLGVTAYRSLSKNIWARQKENMRFLEVTKGIRLRYKVYSMNLTDKKSKYFICPRCMQMVKVPRGKGAIEISCPRCKSSFDRRS